MAIIMPNGGVIIKTSNSHRVAAAKLKGQTTIKVKGLRIVEGKMPPKTWKDMRVPDSLADEPWFIEMRSESADLKPEINQTQRRQGKVMKAAGKLKHVARGMV